MTKSNFTKTNTNQPINIICSGVLVPLLLGWTTVAGYQSMSNSVKDLTELIEIQMEWDELDRDAQVNHLTR